MWCKNCGQDVPRVAVPGSGKLCCLRCGKPVADESAARQRTDSARDVVSGGARPSGYDAWDLDEDLRHVGRVLGKAASTDAGNSSSSGKKFHRIDAAHGTMPGQHYGRRPPGSATGRFDFFAALVGGIAWLSMTLGLMASACGGVLLVWAKIVGREQLWSVGLPIAVAGLLGLLVALLLQLERLAGDHRQTAAALERFNHRLHQMRRDSEMSAGNASPTGSAFYAHWANEASPHLLLTDLKSQLDLLAARLGESESEMPELDLAD